MEKTTTPIGQVLKIPKGTSCSQCYQAWMSAFFPEFPNFDALADAYHKDSDVQARVRTGLDILAGRAQREFPSESVHTSVDARITVSRDYLILNDAELRTELGVSRLLKAHTKGVGTMMVPSETRVNEQENVWVFADPNRPFRRATVAIAVGSSSQAEVMGVDRSAYEGQASHHLQLVWGTQGSEATALLSKGLPTLDEHLQSQGIVKDVPARAASRPQPAKGLDDGDEGNESDGASRPTEVVGIAAKAHISSALASPAKVVPAVPRFEPSTPPTSKLRRTTSTGGLLGMARSGALTSYLDGEESQVQGDDNGSENGSAVDQASEVDGDMAGFDDEGHSR